MRAGFAQFTAFSQDARDDKIFEQTKLTMPVLAVGGEKSFGSLQAVIMRHVATNVREAVVKGSGHWLMEERPAETVALFGAFSRRHPRIAAINVKLSDQEIARLEEPYQPHPPPEAFS
jgi:pimeloyl-ACP methyl ester carboxylesterase